ncbi:histidine phosphatase family protein [Pseudoalteromonas sp. S16_S37]|uniref:histidine phosphatase family protein n=1 Tax=Pseudoalteromonas sp. S16_S37 TaxID=2720228 RepID=UPI00168064A3|nr:histidine phosphatase family protein [Pseudoalteromonas sp. S16_S37]MBD1580833.1 hypothetical protein [Pseudoalteromonas sp. S16_S37]
MHQVWHFIRHGQPQSKGCLLGASDIPLSDEGWQQLVDSVAHLTQVDTIVSSPLKRCRDFAEHVSAKLKCLLLIEPRLQEMNFGDWDGKSYEVLWQQTSNPTIGQFWQSPDCYTPPNGESLQLFQARVINWWSGQLRHNRSANNVVFTHAGVIKQLVSHILKLEPNNTHAFHALEVGYGKCVTVHVYYDEQDKAWAKVVF